MRRSILILIPAALVLLACVPLARTPNPSTWTRELLLGANGEVYVSYILERKNPGSYYEFTEKHYLSTFNAADGSVVEKRLLRETFHRDTTTLGDWARVDTVRETIDVGQYLAERNVGVAFPDNAGTVEVSVDGAFLRLGDRRELLVSAGELKNVLADPAGPVRLVEQYTAPFSGYRFLSISSGYGGDQDAATRILPVPEAEYMRVLSKLREQIETTMGKEIPARPPR